MMRRCTYEGLMTYEDEWENVPGWTRWTGNPTIADILQAAKERFPDVPFEQLKLASEGDFDVRRIYLYRR